MSKNIETLIIVIAGIILSALFIYGVIFGLSPNIFIILSVIVLVYILGVSYIKKDKKLLIVGLGLLIIGQFASIDSLLFIDNWTNQEIYKSDSNIRIANVSLAILSTPPWFMIISILKPNKITKSNK